MFHGRNVLHFYAGEDASLTLRLDLPVRLLYSEGVWLGRTLVVGARVIGDVGLGVSETAAQLVDHELQQTMPAFTRRRAVEPTRVRVLAEHRHHRAPELFEIPRLHKHTHMHDA